MKRIESFCVNHDILEKGLYLSRVDGAEGQDPIYTYDLRMVKPNGGVYLENAAIHTFEHLFATYVRNTEYSDSIIYVGPMGCRTGFYFITRGLPHEIAIVLVQKTMAFIAQYEGEIPGSSRIECGNYLDHDLNGARKIAADMISVLANWAPEQLIYKN